MILHELRVKPMRLYVALWIASGACEVHDDTVWNEARGTSIDRGSAVAPWVDAQVLSHSDAEVAGADGSEAEGGAAMSGDATTDASLAAPMGDAGSSDASFDGGADSSAFDVAASGIDARCAFRITTLQLGGRYAPKNIGAIWVEQAGGGWVKTLAVWAGVRLRYLTGFRSANPTGNKVDAVTSATLPMHESHVVGWNLADAQGSEVADGAYQIKVEVTDRDAVGQTWTFPFMKHTPPFASTAADTQYFADVELRCR